MKVKQEDGTEIEVLTPAEVEAKIAEKETEINKSWESKVTEAKGSLDQAIAEKADLEKKLADAGKGGHQDENFKTLKAAMDKKDDEIKKLQTDVALAGQTRVNDFRDQTISKMVGKDEELKKKVLHHFNETLKSVDAKTPEDIQKKIESAVKLSVDVSNPGVLAAVLAGTGGPGLPANSGGAVEFTATEKALGSKLGISEDDYKKYGPRLKTKLPNK